MSVHMVECRRAKKGEKKCSRQIRTMTGWKQCPRPAGPSGKCVHHGRLA